MIRRRHLLAAVPALLAGAGAAPRLDRSRLRLSFAEEFDAPISLYDPSTGTGRWKTNWDFGGQADASSRTLNDELEVYSDPGFNGINPFVQSPGMLAITADHAPPDAARPYTSGLITTSKSFQQRYGYFEMRAALPQGSGLWPAFWLLVPFAPDAGTAQYPGEIDVMEALGKRPSTIFCSTHWPITADLSQKRDQVIPIRVGATDRLRTYGVLWTERDITWYLDDAQVAQTANPGLHQPMLILANLAVGGAWGGPPTHRTRFPARLLIDHIRAYRLQ